MHKSWKRKQTAVKGRFTAILISAAVHVAVLIAAGTFVAVTVVQRQEARFEGRQVSRPRMQLQRLQVPQRVRQERQAPQMSQRVTAQAVSTRSSDFQMPEIAGLGGGISVDMSGAGFAGSLGFSTPQLNLFGIRSQGEKVVFLLDATTQMLVDEVGGIPAYEIIKEELMRMIGQLPATTLFNVIVFAGPTVLPQAFSEELSPATRENIERFRQWISPLNAVKGQRGLQTLGFVGYEVEFEPMVPIANTQRAWIAGLSWAIQNGADVVYWMGRTDHLRWIYRPLYEGAKRGRPVDPPDGQPPELLGYDYSAYPGGEARWNQLVAQARQMHEDENARRRAAGLPERVMSGFGSDGAFVRNYLPGVQIPPDKVGAGRYTYTTQDIVEYIQNMLSKYESREGRATRTGLRGHRGFSFNVVHFVPVGAPPKRINLSDVPRRFRGEYVQIQGLEAIQSARQ